MNHRSFVSVSVSLVCAVFLLVRAECADEPIDSHFAISHSDSEEPLDDAEDMLVNSHIVALGRFATLSTPETKDIFSFRPVKQRFHIVELYKGPSTEWIDVLVSSHSLPFPGEDISVYEKNQRLNNRLTLLNNQINDLSVTIRGMSPGDEQKDYVNILRGFAKERREIVQQYPDLPQMLVIDSPVDDRRDHVRPILTDVQYLVSLRAKRDGIYVFPEGEPNLYSPDTFARRVAALRLVLDSAERMARIRQGEQSIGTGHEDR